MDPITTPTTEFNQQPQNFDGLVSDLNLFSEELTYEHLEPIFNFLPKMMNIIQELPKSDSGESVLIQIKDLYDSAKGAQEFMDGLAGADLTEEQQHKLYSENLIKIKEKS